MLDQRAQQALTRISREVQELFDGDLVCLALYGSAAGEDFVAGKSDLNLAVVLKEVRFEHLRALHTHLRDWRELGAGTPLLLDRDSLSRGRDVFPMEFQDIKEMHKLLAGEDVFAGLQIDWRNLRYQAEHEVRGKLLRLRALYAEVGPDRERLQRLLVDSVKTFIIVMRGLIRLREPAAATAYGEVLSQFEVHTSATFPTMRFVLQVKLDRQTWPADTEAMMRSYLSEVQRLTDLVDVIQPD